MMREREGRFWRRDHRVCEWWGEVKVARVGALELHEKAS